MKRDKRLGSPFLDGPFLDVELHPNHRQKASLIDDSQKEFY